MERTTHPEHIKLVISDFHLSRGRYTRDGRRNPLEDFHQDERFREMLEHYTSGHYAQIPVELVVNGDFFDPLAVNSLPEPGRKTPRLDYPTEVEEDAAVSKFRLICEGHPVTIDALRSFLQRGKKIIFRWGNHDAALLWPKVQEAIREILGPPRPEALEFQQQPYVFDRICIDHGHQYETLNHFDENRMFLDRRTKEGVKRIQNLPFGSFFVLGFLNRIKLKRSYINQVYPFKNYLLWSLFMDPVFFFVNGFKVAWFFIKMRFVTHPMRFARIHKTFLLITESFHRKSLEDHAEKTFFGATGSEVPYDILILGHNHQAAHRVFPGGKTYLNTGTWIPLTSLDIGSLGHRVMRTYALIEYLNGKPRVALKVWHGETHKIEDYL